MNKRQQNKISTPGYFIKRLRDSNYGVIRIFQNYPESDARRWTVLIDPGNTSVFITCFENRDKPGEILFEFHDGGQRFIKNFAIKTESIEVIVQHLVEKNIPTLSKDSAFYKEKV